MHRRGSRRSLAIGALAVAVGVAAVTGAAGAGYVSTYDLSGHWKTPGTSLTLTQSGRTITWTGGPNNRAWIQTFKGTITDDPTYGPSFSGTFRQDEPGRLPPRYHGTMKAQIRDSCEFVFLSIVQEGQPTLRNVFFEKDPCTVSTPPLARLNLILFRKRYVADSKQKRSCPSSFECVVRHGATLSICNRDDFRHQPFSLLRPNRFGGPAGKLVLKPGQCYDRALVNPRAEVFQVRLYDAIHSQERFIVTVLPRAR